MRFCPSGPVRFESIDMGRQLRRAERVLQRERLALGLLGEAISMPSAIEHVDRVVRGALRHVMFNRFVEARLWRRGRALIAELPQARRAKLVAMWNTSRIPAKGEYLCHWLRMIGVNVVPYQDVIDWYLRLVNEFDDCWRDVDVETLIERAAAPERISPATPRVVPQTPRDGGRRERHILSLSGGRDSTALAIYMRDHVPDMEYAFCDTGKELPETYEYMSRLERYLGREIVVLGGSAAAFDEILNRRRGFLPSMSARWCTRCLKIEPFERYVGGDPAVIYVGIRADENRAGHIPSRPNIRARAPFVEDGIRLADVQRILDDAGLGIPGYYRWRSRSGCYFCFFQRISEWVGLLVNCPELYVRAAAYERIDGDTTYTWVRGRSLISIAQMARWGISVTSD